MSSLKARHRAVQVIDLAAQMRRDHYINMGATPLHWSQLTDAQKLSWLLKAVNAIDAAEATE